MEQVDIKAIGTFIDDRTPIIINDLNLNDITTRNTLSSDIITNICKYPIKISRVVSFSGYYDYDHNTQPIEPQIPLIDINCTPIKLISSETPYSMDTTYNININGYQIISDTFNNQYQIMINTFNNIIKVLNFNSVFYVDFVDIDKVNKIGFYYNTEYHINSDIKDYFQKAFNYLKKECKLYFEKNKSYLFLDTNHNEIIIYNNSVIYRFTNLNIDKYDPLLQKYTPSSLNCFEEFIINESTEKSIIKAIDYDEPEEISDDEDDYGEDYDY